MGIFEIGGVGPPGPRQVLVLATTNTPLATSGGTNGASAASTNTTATIEAAGAEPPFNLCSSCEAQVTFGGFALPTLPTGAVVTAIQVQVAYTGTFATDNPGAGFIVFNALPASIGFPTLPSSGVWLSSSIGTSIGDFSSLTFQLRNTSQFSNFVGSLEITSIGLLVSYTLPSGSLGGDTVDAVATSSNGAAAATSTLTNGLPGYLMAISLYPGGGAVPVEDVPLWRAVTPENFAGNSPTTFQAQQRIIYSPGDYAGRGRWRRAGHRSA